jgi:hypothetical protein
MRINVSGKRFSNVFMLKSITTGLGIESRCIFHLSFFTVAKEQIKSLFNKCFQSNI